MKAAQQIWGIVWVTALCLLFPAQSFGAERTRVAFLNPGGPGDAFFQPMTDFMQAAADDLGFELTVYFANRNHVLYDENIHRLFSTQPLPEYIIGTNARGSGKALLKVAEAAGVKTLFVNQGFIDVEQIVVGAPGERYKQWLFEYLPDDVNAGYLLAKTLLDEAVERSSDGTAEVLAITGHEESVASVLRLRGLKEALVEYPGVRLNQAVYADWKRDKAKILTHRLLERYPSTSVIWSASDVMAHGACEALRETGRKPGSDVVVGGVDWADSALDSLRKKEFTASVGGHFMDGGWAMVLLYDMMHGIQPDKLGRSSFSVLTADNVDVYARLREQSWTAIDFRAFSKHLNPELKQYNFGLEAVLKQLQ